MTLHGSLRIRSGARSKWKSCGAALVRPDALHELQADPGSTVVLGFIDVESDLGAALSETIRENVSSVPATRVSQWRAALGPDLDPIRIEQWVRKDLLNGRCPVKIHPGVTRAIKHIRQRLARGEDFSLKNLAAISGLSPSRFMHVFTQSVHVPLRPYILWLRLQRSACELMNGASATEAAHIAGFSDGAHLTRTFKRMLGTTPRELELRSRMSQGVPIER